MLALAHSQAQQDPCSLVFAHVSPLSGAPARRRSDLSRVGHQPNQRRCSPRRLLGVALFCDLWGRSVPGMLWASCAASAHCCAPPCTRHHHSAHWSYNWWICVIANRSPSRWSELCPGQQNQWTMPLELTCRHLRHFYRRQSASRQQRGVLRGRWRSAVYFLASSTHSAQVRTHQPRLPLFRKLLASCCDDRLEASPHH